MARWAPGSRERLQAAALDLFTEQGFEQTTVAEIAQRVGVTTRTFFRHFSDKRDVLFAGSGELERRLTHATAAAPAQLEPLEATLAAVAAVDWHRVAARDAQRRRQAVIAASPELTERDLIKLEALVVALASGLRRRGTDEATALLAARAGLVVFRTAYRRWVDAEEETDMGDTLRAVLAELRAMVTPPSILDDRPAAAAHATAGTAPRRR